MIGATLINRQVASRVLAMRLISPDSPHGTFHPSQATNFKDEIIPGNTQVIDVPGPTLFRLAMSFHWPGVASASNPSGRRLDEDARVG
jgi:hypothetical protein